jgi:hypothetical protein
MLILEVIHELIQQSARQQSAVSISLKHDSAEADKQKYSPNFYYYNYNPILKYPLLFGIYLESAFHIHSIMLPVL